MTRRRPAGIDTGARCPVCAGSDLAVTLTAASCNGCGYGWPVAQLALPLNVPDAAAAPARTVPGSPLTELRERSARTRWLATGKATP